jgi:hypothetical protein
MCAPCMHASSTCLHSLLARQGRVLSFVLLLYLPPAGPDLVLLQPHRLNFWTPTFYSQHERMRDHHLVLRAEPLRERPFQPHLALL